MEFASWTKKPHPRVNENEKKGKDIKEIREH